MALRKWLTSWPPLTCQPGTPCQVIAALPPSRIALRPLRRRASPCAPYRPQPPLLDELIAGLAAGDALAVIPSEWRVSERTVSRLVKKYAGDRPLPLRPGGKGKPRRRGPRGSRETQSTRPSQKEPDANGIEALCAAFGHFHEIRDEGAAVGCRHTYFSVAFEKSIEAAPLKNKRCGDMSATSYYTASVCAPCAAPQGKSLEPCDAVYVPFWGNPDGPGPGLALN